MNHTAGRLTGVIAVCALSVFLAPGCGSQPQETGSIPQEAAVPAGSQPATDEPLPASTATEPTVEVSLYFADSTGGLKPERRELPAGGSPSRRARRVVEALLEGPKGSLTRTLPRGTVLRECYVVRDGTAFVDLDAAFALGLSKGSEDALVAVWSLTNTLAAAVPEIHQVKILVEGEEVSDLGGHLDLTQPVLPAMDLIQDVERTARRAGAPPG